MDSLQLQRAGLLEGQSVSQGPQERCQLFNMLEETNFKSLRTRPFIFAPDKYEGQGHCFAAWFCP